jgi:gluconate 2-dehydrogenase gamma chain
VAEQETQDQLSRRKALQIMVGSAGLVANLPIVQPASGAAPPSMRAGLCHVPPRSQAAKAVHVPQFFSAQQLEEIAALADTVIPTDEHSPGARAARVHEFIDEIIAISEPSTKELWGRGLAAVDEVAVGEYQKRFAECAANQQTALLEKIALREDQPRTVAEKFFVALKKATVEGYYTSAIGIHQDLQYQGNTALLEFPGCTHGEHKR